MKRHLNCYCCGKYLGQVTVQVTVKSHHEVIGEYTLGDCCVDVVKAETERLKKMRKAQAQADDEYDPERRHRAMQIEHDERHYDQGELDR